MASIAPIRLACGLGQATECPFFADIYVPSSVRLGDTVTPGLPVKVFIHGGFLQFGSTSGQHYTQQGLSYMIGSQRALSHRSYIVLSQDIVLRCGERFEFFSDIGTRPGIVPCTKTDSCIDSVSVLGFLAASDPVIHGNYGYKDCWLGLHWVKGNCSPPRLTGSFKALTGCALGEQRILGRLAEIETTYTSAGSAEVRELWLSCCIGLHGRRRNRYGTLSVICGKSSLQLYSALGSFHYRNSTLKCHIGKPPRHPHRSGTIRCAMQSSGH